MCSLVQCFGFRLADLIRTISHSGDMQILPKYVPLGSGSKIHIEAEEASWNVSWDPAADKKMDWPILLLLRDWTLRGTPEEDRCQDAFVHLMTAHLRTRSVDEQGAGLRRRYPIGRPCFQLVIGPVQVVWVFDSYE